VKFLLIDFGASFIKTSVYDLNDKTFDSYSEVESPFIKSKKIPISQIKNIINKITEQYKDIDYIVSCSIKNGCVQDNEYISWKLLNPKDDYPRESLLSCIFINEEFHHVHHEHDSSSKIEKLEKLGVINNKIFLSCLGDTECVRRSVNLLDGDVLLNLGTGAQIISNSFIKSFFPSGRMFLTFSDFFNSFGCNFFEDLSEISVQNILESTLKFDLNIFPQSRNFNDFGFIKNINENNFTKNNFLSSLLKAYAEQFINEIDLKTVNKIYFSGGIPKKIPAIVEYIGQKTNLRTFLVSSNIPETHLGMKEMIERNFEIR
jgi:hypothetical protein